MSLPTPESVAWEVYGDCTHSMKAICARCFAAAIRADRLRVAREVQERISVALRDMLMEVDGG